LTNNSFENHMTKKERISGFLLIVAHSLVLPLLAGVFVRFVYIPGLTDIRLNVAIYALSFILILIFMGGYMKKSFHMLIENFRNSVVAVASSYVIYYVLNFAVTYVIASIAAGIENPNDEALVSISALDKRSLVALALLLAPIVEEPFFRGVVFGTIKEKNRLWAYALSFLAFSVYHLYPYFISNYSPMLFWNLLQYFPSSFALARCYERSGSIWACIVLHMLINGVTLYLYLNYK